MGVPWARASDGIKSSADNPNAKQVTLIMAKSTVTGAGLGKPKGKAGRPKNPEKVELPKVLNLIYEDLTVRPDFNKRVV